MTMPRPKTWSGPNHTGQTQVNLVDTVGRRLLTVSRVEELTPKFKRVYLTGDALADGFPYVHLAPTDHIKLVFPQPGASEVEIPTRGPSGWITPSGKAPIFRDYTVRGWLPNSQELIVEFVVHGHGVASSWAANAKPGDQLGVLGPRGNIVFPQNYSHYVLAGDEAVIPALSRFVEELPANVTAHVVIEVADAAEVRTLTDRENFTFEWVLRDQAGTGGLLAAIRGVELPTHDDWFVFAAGEAGSLKPIRDYFRLELALPKERVVVDGYWKRGLSNLDHHSINLNED